MNSLRQIFYCAGINFRKWFTKPQYFILVLLTVQINLVSFLGYTFFCLKTDSLISPWVLPFMTSGTVPISIYGFLCVLLFCDAPFNDAHTPFVLIRTGKQNWVLGQLLYIFIASLLFILFYYCIAILVLSPVLGYSSDWGGVIRAAGTNPSIFRQYDLPLTPQVGLNSWVLQTFSPLSATLFSLLLMWLTTAFAGVLIFAGNLLVAPGVGTTISMAFVVFSGFATGLGLLLFGSWTYYFSPFLWCILQSYGSFSGMPPFSYTIAALIFAILLLSCISTITFCNKDCDIQKGARK